MLYRKAPPRPTKLLLRVVAVAGAGALLGAAACSSSDSVGSSVLAPDASDDHASGGSVDGGHYDGPNGVVPNPDGGDEHVVTGLVDGGEDASDDHVVSGAVDGGIVVNPDASDDGPVGVIVHPDSGGD
jgi:hypothetical protein